MGELKELLRTRVVHCKKAAYDVYCGRPSKYGNPFTVEAYGRERCIELFRKWWFAPEQATLRGQAVRELAGRVIACWCKPKACHLDVVAEYVNSQVEELIEES